MIALCAAVIRYFMLLNFFFFSLFDCVFFVCVLFCQAQWKHVLSILCLLLLSLLLYCVVVCHFRMIYSFAQRKSMQKYFDMRQKTVQVASRFYYSKWPAILHSNGLCNAHNTLQIYYGFYMLNIKTSGWFFRCCYCYRRRRRRHRHRHRHDRWLINEFYFWCMEMKMKSVDFLVYNLE